MRLSIVLLAVAGTTVAATVPALGQSQAAVFSRGDSKLSTHQITVPDVQSSGLPLWWTTQPPTIEIQGFAQVTTYPTGTVTRDVISPNKQDKFTFSQGGGGFVIGGKIDLRRADAMIPGLFASTYGQWETFATAIPDTNKYLLQTHMLTSARIDAFDPPLEFDAAAASVIYDPFTFPALAVGESLEMTTTLPAVQHVLATGDGVAERTLRVGTSLAGFENLYILTVNASAAGGAPALWVEFSSHPELGLDDETIASAVTAAFVFDPHDQSFGLMTDFTLFDGALPLPSGQPFELYIDDAANTRVVPEPGTVGLLVLGLIAARRRRGR